MADINEPSYKSLSPVKEFASATEQIHRPMLVLSQVLQTIDKKGITVMQMWVIPECSGSLRDLSAALSFYGACVAAEAVKN